MAGTVPTITAGSITGLTALPNRPIYFLKLNGAAAVSLVVKGDAPPNIDGGPANPDAPISIKWGSKLMKNVNNDLVNVKIMTPLEVGIFKQYAQANLVNGSKPYNNLDVNYTWVKMPHAAGLSDAQMTDEVTKKPIQSLIKRNIQTFSDAEIWVDLGKIVAVDIFNGNNDRFDIATGKWMNYGN